MNPEIANEWIGRYSYDPVPGIDLPSVDFKMYLSGVQAGAFTGQIVDGPGGIPEAASIEGTLAANEINFTKRYSSLWISDEHGDQVPLLSQPSSVIEYRGKLNGTRDRIDGTWEIAAATLSIDGVAVDCPRTTGFWFASLESA